MIITHDIDALTREDYYFYLFTDYGYTSPILYIDKYILYKRESIKHKFKVDSKYDRLDSRHNSIKVEDVPFNEALVEEVKLKFLEGLKVLKWEDR